MNKTHLYSELNAAFVVVVMQGNGNKLMNRIKATSSSLGLEIQHKHRQP